MKNDRPQNSGRRLALSPPMTVSAYVQQHFKGAVGKFIAWATLAAPVTMAIRIRESGFAWWKVGLIPVAWAMACALACVLVGLVLAASGWWKIHTTIRPIIPASIAMAAGILAYVLVVNLY